VFHWYRDEEHAAASGFRSLSLTSVTGKRGQQLLSRYPHFYLNIINEGRHLFVQKRTSVLDLDVSFEYFLLDQIPDPVKF
jgi:hypothetical protein